MEHSSLFFGWMLICFKKKKILCKGWTTLDTLRVKIWMIWINKSKLIIGTKYNDSSQSITATIEFFNTTDTLKWKSNILQCPTTYECCIHGKLLLFLVTRLFLPFTSSTSTNHYRGNAECTLLIHQSSCWTQSRKFSRDKKTLQVLWCLDDVPYTRQLSDNSRNLSDILLKILWDGVVWNMWI